MEITYENFRKVKIHVGTVKAVEEDGKVVLVHTSKKVANGLEII